MGSGRRKKMRKGGMVRSEERGRFGKEKEKKEKERRCKKEERRRWR